VRSGSSFLLAETGRPETDLPLLAELGALASGGTVGGAFGGRLPHVRAESGGCSRVWLCTELLLEDVVPVELHKKEDVVPVELHTDGEGHLEAHLEVVAELLSFVTDESRLRQPLVHVESDPTEDLPS